jgi:hypothetical protein
LKRSDFLARGTFEIHSEPQHRNDYSCHSRGNVLCDLGTFLAGKLFHLDVVRFDLRDDHRASRIGIRRLDGSNWLRIAAGGRKFRRNSEMGSAAVPLVLNVTCFGLGDPLVRQVLGAIAQFEKTSLVAKLKAARDRKRAATGKCGGRKSYGEARPEVVALAKELRGQRMSLRKISAELAWRGYTTASGKPYVASAIQAMLG